MLFSLKKFTIFNYPLVATVTACQPVAASVQLARYTHTAPVQSAPKDPVGDTCSDVGRHSCGICEYLCYQILGGYLRLFFTLKYCGFSRSGRCLKIVT